MHRYRKKAIVYLIIALIFFLITFLFAYWTFINEKSILNLGYSFKIENYIVMILSIFAIIRVIYEIIMIEHPRDFEDRVLGHFEKKILKKS